MRTFMKRRMATPEWLVPVINGFIQRPGRQAALRSVFFCVLAMEFTGTAGDWPQWRGPSRDGHAAPDENLPEGLPSNLEPVWQQPAGSGFASPITAGDRLFLAEEDQGQEVLRALRPATGAQIWNAAYGPSDGDEWGSGPRCTPLADEDRIYVQSMRGEFACVSQEDGRTLWRFSFEKDYGVEWAGGGNAPTAASRRRGHSGAPVVLRDRIYVAVGATDGATVVAFDKRNGKELWRSGEDETAYAALITGPLAGRQQLVAYTAGGLRGLDLDTGEHLWQVPLRTAANRHAVTPILLADSVIVSSHTIGLRAFRTVAQEGRTRVAPLWSVPSLKTSIATMVHVAGHLYGQGPDQNFVCVDAATGDVKWDQPGFGERPLVGYSSTLAAGDRLLVLTDDGQLVLMRANPERYVELGRVQICGRTWSHHAFAGGRLYVRDRRALLAFDLRDVAGR
jgi:outer membrane protein assembly factor BamB